MKKEWEHKKKYVDPIDNLCDFPAWLSTCWSFQSIIMIILLVTSIWMITITITITIINIMIMKMWIMLCWAGHSCDFAEPRQLTHGKDNLMMQWQSRLCGFIKIFILMPIQCIVCNCGLMWLRWAGRRSRQSQFQSKQHSGDTEIVNQLYSQTKASNTLV